MKKKTADIFLVAGGSESRRRGDPLLAGILARIGRARPAVAYIGAASNDNRVFFMWVASLLKKAGAGSVQLAPLASRRADLAGARRLLQEADLVFVSGGDVEAGMGVLERTGVCGLIGELHQAGKPFIGMSAGSIMLSRGWVRWADPDDDRTAAVFPCLGLAPLFCDTHAEKEDWLELKALLRLTGAGMGFGIPSGAALQIGAGGSLSALGHPVRRVTLTGSLPDLKPQPATVLSDQ